MGIPLRFLYHIVRHGWNSYLRMIEIDYPKTFTCPKCKDNPDVIIMDGIMMGTVKNIPEYFNQYDEGQIYEPIPISERVFIQNTDSRKQLIEYCQGGLSDRVFHNTVTSLDFREFADYVTYSSSTDGQRVIIDQDYPLVKRVIEHFCHQESITGLFQFSLLTKVELSTVVLLSEGNARPRKDLGTILQKMQILKHLFISLTSTKCIIQLGEDFILLPIIARLLKAIIIKIDYLFKKPSRKLIEFKEFKGAFTKPRF